MALGFAAVVISGSLSAYYFFGVEKGIELSSFPWRSFYSQLSPDCLRLSEDEMRTSLKNGKGEPVAMLAMRAALDRWRLKAVAPEAFPNLMRNYEGGLWKTDGHEAWERTFKWLDGEWIEARRKVLNSSEPSPALKLERNAQVGLLISIPSGVVASRLGSRLIIEGESPESAVPDTPAKVYWDTVQSPGVSNLRRRLASWTAQSTGTIEHYRSASFTADFSWEPFWIAPGAQPLQLRVVAPGLGTWRNLRIRFDDSPLLPVN